MRDFNRDSIFKKAVDGAYFGIVNTLLVFIPFVYSVFENRALFIIHIIAALLLLGLFISVIAIFKNSHNYTFSGIRYLLFISVFSGILLSGLALKYIISFPFTFANLYFFILQVTLILMSAIDILIPAHNGMIRMRSLYLRTIKGQYFNNFLTAALGAALGILLVFSAYNI